MIKAILFDLDGTLLDTLKDLHEAVNYSIGKFDYKLNELSDTKKYVGNGILNLLKRSVNFDDAHIDEIYKDFKEYYKNNCNIYTRPYDGVYKLLDYIKSKNIKMGVISNKAIFALDILVKAHFDGYFDIVLGDGMGLAKKPDPEVLNYAFEKLGVTKNEALYIGDSDVDIKTVENAGCEGVFVTFGFRAKEDLAKLTDKLFDSYEALEAYIINILG